MNITDVEFERIVNNVNLIKEGIRRVAEKNGITADSIHLIGVTKNRTPQEIDTAIKAGIDYIGENRVQEAENKLPLISAPYKEFHYIGHLQKNKIKKLMSLKPALIHSIDSLTTAQKLNEFLEEQNLQQPILVQINTSGEESKYGLTDDFALIKEFIDKLSKLKMLKIKGLMTLAVYSDDENRVRACFQSLKYQAEKINRGGLLDEPLEILSMGMSNDYLVAIEEGSNMVRIGSAIFE